MNCPVCKLKLEELVVLNQNHFTCPEKCSFIYYKDFICKEYDIYYDNMNFELHGITNFLSVYKPNVYSSKTFFREKGKNFTYTEFLDLLYGEDPKEKLDKLFKLLMFI